MKAQPNYSIPPANYKVTSPVEAFQKAWEVLPMIWDRAEFTRHLDRVRLLRYDNGLFALEADTQRIADIFNRHAEKNIIRREIQLYVPDDVQVCVEVVVKAVNHVAAY